MTWGRLDDEERKVSSGQHEELDGPAWEWSPPDLSPEGPWHHEQVQNLMAAMRSTQTRTDFAPRDLRALDIHRCNFESDGTVVQLQILWWEFPPEHWETLRDGSPMNFLMEPTKGISPNAPMTEEQMDIAVEFIDELWQIGVFKEVPEGCELKANAPLFNVPKPGQPRQWRVITDMKNGGQNDHIGKDPVHVPQARGILERLYTGGWSAIVDASKFFHHFPTHHRERLALFGVHPPPKRVSGYGI